MIYCDDHQQKNQQYHQDYPPSSKTMRKKDAFFIGHRHHRLQQLEKKRYNVDALCHCLLSAIVTTVQKSLLDLLSTEHCGKNKVNPTINHYQHYHKCGENPPKWWLYHGFTIGFTTSPLFTKGIHTLKQHGNPEALIGQFWRYTVQTLQRYLQSNQ